MDVFELVAEELGVFGEVSGTGISTSASSAPEANRRIVVRAVPRLVVLEDITGLTITRT